MAYPVGLPSWETAKLKSRHTTSELEMSLRLAYQLQNPLFAVGLKAVG